MPTTRPRFAITETDQVARVLDIASRRWPGRTPAQLLVLLAEVGAEQIEDAETNRLAAIRSTSGALTGVFGTDYLTKLREDWPE